jgi:hypothetical protein
MEELMTELGPKAIGLVALVPLIVSRLKKMPLLTGLQKKGYPAYEAVSVLLGIGSTFATGLANPVVAGILIGLAGIGGRQISKIKEK